MKMRNQLLYFFLVSLYSCHSGPEVLEAQEIAPQAKGIFNSNSSQTPSMADDASQIHTIELLDSLQGSKYSYFKVSEAGKEFWIATMKLRLPLQEKYIFEKGLFKTNYYSTEFDRNFEEIYLVSDLRPLNNLKSPNSNVFEEVVQGATKSSSIPNEKSLDREGSVKIRELIANSGEYVGKQVQITAKVVKINPNIMDRNWLHLQDGSFDTFDMVATSLEAVPAGHIVTLKATLAKDVNFGAGYSYDFILQNAQLLK